MALLNSIKIKGLLSFGGNGIEIKVNGLNVLIGPNGSGKSNLIEIIGLLKSIPNDILTPIRQGGGINEWFWKGSITNQGIIEVVIEYPEGIMPLRYKLILGRKAQTFEIIEEHLAGEKPSPGFTEPYLFLDFKNYRGILNKKPSKKMGLPDDNRHERILKPESLEPSLSVLAQIKDPYIYPEITYLSKKLSQIKLYREWNFGRYTSPRLPQKTDIPEDFLLEDASNLGLVLNNLQHIGQKDCILEYLRIFYAKARDISVKIHGGTVQLYLHEEDLLEPIPATRLSDGTLRFLCLLSILCHPFPPPLICLEEPELGLHPDIIPTLAKMLIDASKTTQLIVTTHSDILVDALSGTPESILVCENGEEGSVLNHLDTEMLKIWLDDYSLGQLWRKGEIGGNRW